MNILSRVKRSLKRLFTANLFKGILLFILTGLMQINLSAQILTVHPDDEGIYEYLDELASMQLIEINSAIKPFSRKYIAAKLDEAKPFKQLLNNRQQKQLEFYLKEYEKELAGGKEMDHLIKRVAGIREPHERRADLFFYRDSIFRFWVNPIGAYQYFTNENGSFYHQYTGAEAYAYVNNNWGIYASFRDNEVNMNIADPAYLHERRGEDNKSGMYFSDMRGGAYYSWKWGSIGFVKDHFIWGNNENGSVIFNDRIPSIPQIKLHLNPVKWLDFHYIHAFLVSEVVDSTRIFNFGGGAVRKEFYPKYLAANMYSLKVWKHLTFSVGNSMVYSNTNVQPGYLIPFIFFKSIEHTIAASNENNAQLFLDVSSRNIKYLHLYGSFYMDEVNFGNMWDADKHSNWFAYKAGFKLSNFPLQNLALYGEFTRTNPMIYKHYYPTSTFESNQYCLGHYLRDNAQEFFAGISYKPIRGLKVELNYTYAEKGPDYPDIRGGSSSILGKKFMEQVAWSSSAWKARVRYEIFHSAFAFAEFMYSDIRAIDQSTLDKYTPSYYQGMTNTFSFGLNFGF